MRVQAIKDTNGRLYALLAEPQSDPMFMLARIDADSIEVQNLPIRDFTTNPALILDSFERPLVLQSQPFRYNLLAWFNYNGVWEARPLKTYPPFLWDRNVVAGLGGSKRLSLALVSWPCTGWEGWDPDCNGESGGGL